MRVRLRNSRQRLCGIRGGNWQKPKPWQHRQKEAAARVHAANERGVSPRKPGAARCPMWRNARAVGQIRPQRAKEKAITAKTAPRDIRGVSQGRRRLRTAANETVRSVTTQAQIQTHAQKIRLAAQKVAGGTGKTAVAVRSAIRNFLADLHSLTAILAAGQLCPKHSHYNQPCGVCVRLGLRHLLCRRCPQRSVRHRARSRRHPDRRIPRQAGKKSPIPYSTTAKTLLPTMMYITSAGRTSWRSFPRMWQAANKARPLRR